MLHYARYMAYDVFTRGCQKHKAFNSGWLRHMEACAFQKGPVAPRPQLPTPETCGFETTSDPCQAMFNTGPLCAPQVQFWVGFVKL